MDFGDVFQGIPILMKARPLLLLLLPSLTANFPQLVYKGDVMSIRQLLNLIGDKTGENVTSFPSFMGLI